MKENLACVVVFFIAVWDHVKKWCLPSCSGRSSTVLHMPDCAVCVTDSICRN